MKNYLPLVRRYARGAPHYDRRWRYYNQATLTATLESIPREKVQRLLNVGCGTGLLEQAVEDLFPKTQVTGLDLSLEMLRQAGGKFTATWQPAWVNSQAESLPFAEGSFDALVCANSFHYYQQPVRVMDEFRRVLRRGGWLVLTDWCDDFLACKICDRVLRIVDRAHYRTYGLEQCGDLLTKAGFHVDEARRFKIDWLWGLMTLRARATSTSPPPTHHPDQTEADKAEARQPEPSTYPHQ